MELTDFSIETAQYTTPFTYTITDLCGAPTLSLTTTISSTYTYNFDNSILSIQADDATITPDACTKSYACRVVSNPGNGVNLCSTAYSSFDASTLIWTFQSNDPSAIDAGEY